MIAAGRLRFLAISLSGGAVAFALAMVWLPSARVDGGFVPMEFDSFYHARRIADSVLSPSSFLEYDRRNYAPEGTWISWPWAFDWTLARIASAGMAVTDADDPMDVLVWLPPASAFVNAALVVAVGEAAGLAWPLQLMLALLFGLCPLTQQLHGAGRIDHHFAEFTFVQATLLAMLRWTSRPSSSASAAILGAVLGLSQAVQNGLFILQLPVLGALGLLWWRGCGLATPRTAGAFAAGLVGTTLALALPSEPFRAGLFDWTLLSWFHAYVAVATSLFVAALAFAPHRASSAAALAALAGVLALPMAGQVLGGAKFLGAALHDYAAMGELQTVIGHTAAGGFSARESTMLYTPLVWMGPAVLAWGLWRLARPGRDLDTPLAVFTLFGLALMHQQYRLHYFGSFTMWLPLLLEANRVLPSLAPAARRAATGALAAVLLLAHLPCRSQLTTAPAAGLTPLYGSLRAFYLSMHELCARDAGVLLADRALGNFIRYHSDCAVMASNMLIDQSQAARVQRLEGLMDGSLTELRKNAPFVKYAFVMRADRDWGRPTPEEARKNRRGLRGELLHGETPHGVRVVQEATMTEDGRQVAFARLVDLRPEAAPQ
jgi:hypothetical protein